MHRYRSEKWVVLFKLAPVWPEQMRGLFLHDGSIADGVPVGPVSRLYVESPENRHTDKIQ